MRRVALPCVGLALSACVLMAGTPQAWGSNAYANNYNGLKTANFDPKGDYGVFALTFQNDISNNTVTGDVVLNGAKVNNPGITVPMGQKVAEFQGGNGNGFFLKSELAKFNDHRNLMSMTGQYSSTASAYVDNAGNRKAKATATNKKPAVNPQPGGAIATVIDPFAVSSGSPYSYAPTVSGGLQLDGVGDSGSAYFFAVDSYLFTTDSIENYYADGAPASGDLWSLNLTGSGPTVGTSSVNVDFELNPLALSEITFPGAYLASLGNPGDPATAAALIDASIDTSISMALTYDPTLGEVDLPDGFTPFPDGTTYTAAAGGVEYGDGAEAEVAGVPEPSGLALLGVVGLGLLRRRNRG